MTLAKALDILIRHNQWRRGEIELTWVELDYTAKDLGVAIDVCVTALNRQLQNEKDKQA